MTTHTGFIWATIVINISLAYRRKRPLASGCGRWGSSTFRKSSRPRTGEVGAAALPISRGFIRLAEDPFPCSVNI